MTAAQLRQTFPRVLLCEMGRGLLQRASYNNQARVHNGYHYPRSLLTALRSRVNFPRFVEEFAGCIVSSFTKLYAIPRRQSKVSAAQFRTFIRRVGAPISVFQGAERKLFNFDLIEEVFLTTEYAFDAVKLAAISRQILTESGVEVRTETEVSACAAEADGDFRVALSSGETVTAGKIYNCTYSRLNHCLKGAGLPPVKLRHEIAELCLVEPPAELGGAGVTVMCGPFFSCMPFPARRLHSLSHVRYTPHTSWADDEAGGPDPYRALEAWPKQTAFPFMVRDAARFMPCLARCEYRDSLWEVKTILPRNDGDDGRPILYQHAAGHDGFTTIMGGKIDNIFDCQMELERELSPEHSL